MYTHFWVIKAHLSIVAEITNSFGFSKKLAPGTPQTLIHMLHFILFCFQALWIPGDLPRNLPNKQLILKVYLNLFIWIPQPSGTVTLCFNTQLRWPTLSFHCWWQVQRLPPKVPGHRFLSCLALSSCSELMPPAPPSQAWAKPPCFQFPDVTNQGSVYKRPVSILESMEGNYSTGWRWERDINWTLAWTVTEIHNRKCPDQDSLTGCHLFEPLGHWSFFSHLQKLFPLFFSRWIPLLPYHSKSN